MSKITNYTSAGQVAGRYAWYINNAMRELITQRTEQVTRARHTIAQSLVKGTNEYEHRNHPAGYGEPIYRSLEAMAEEVERGLVDYKKAWDALKEAGIE